MLTQDEDEDLEEEELRLERKRKRLQSSQEENIEEFEHASLAQYEK